jgi:hypothetical protein
MDIALMLRFVYQMLNPNAVFSCGQNNCNPIGIIGKNHDSHDDKIEVLFYNRYLILEISNQECQAPIILCRLPTGVMVSVARWVRLGS